MPIDLEALSKDPAFQAKSLAEQQKLMGRAHERNMLESQSGTSAPATPEPRAWWERATDWLQAGEEGRLPLAPTTGEWVDMTPAQQQQRLQQMREMGKTVAAGGIQTATSLGGAAIGGFGGTAIGGPFGTFPGMIAGEVGGSLTGEKLNVALGLKEPSTLDTMASVAGPLAARGAAALPLLSRASRAGRAVTQAADETAAATTAAAQQTAAAHEAATRQTATQAAAHAEQVRKAEQTAAATTTRAQEIYTARVQQAEKGAAAKTTAQEAKYQRGVQEARARAGEQTLAEQQAYQQQVQDYETAVGAHRTAKTELQAIPEQFGPETPSKTLYAAAAKANPQVELRQTAAMAEELMGTPEGLQTIQRGGVQSLAEELHDLAQQSLSRDGLAYARLQKIREDLGAEVGRLRRQGGAEYRDVARLYGALERDLGGSEAAVLQAASKARRQEYAVEELGSMVQTGAPGIKRLSSGAYQVDPGQLMTRAEKALSDTEKLFGGSFTPDERARILQQFERHQGLAPIPRRPGAPPGPVMPKDVAVPEPVMPRSIMRPVPVQPKDVGPAPTPIEAQTTLAPPPVDPRTLLTPPSALQLRSALGVGVLAAMYSGSVPGGIKVGATIAGLDIVEYALSKMALSPRGRPILDRMMDASGTISAENVQVLMNAARAMGIIGGESRTQSK